MKLLDLRVIHHPFTEPSTRWHVGDHDGRSTSAHPTRQAATDQIVMDFMKHTGTGPDECECTDDDSLVYSMEDGTVVEALADGRVLHLNAEDFERLAGGCSLAELMSA